MQTTQVQNVTYNPARRAFEARVVIADGAELFTYPCQLRAPMDMDATLAARRLAEMAGRMHARTVRPMVSHRPQNVFSTHVPADVASATDALWQRMLGHAA